MAASMCIRVVLSLTIIGASITAAAQTDARQINPAAAKTAQSGKESAEAELPALRVGVEAPDLKVAKWIKGEPVAEFKAGNVYVVEFWATWCGPCRATIPHMTELARKHSGQATFIGVSIWERSAEKTDEGILALVEPFVKEMGDKMEYRVAVDGIGRETAESWMTAAGKNGIPCAFIVGKDGAIAWIGHPMSMDKVLEGVIAGTFDVKAEAKRQETEWRQQQERVKLEAPIRAALTAKDNKAVVEAIDKALAVQPEMEEDLMPVRFNALVQVDEVAGFAYLKTLLEKGSFERNPYHAFNAGAIVSRNLEKLKNPDFALVVAAMEKGQAGEQENPGVLVVYAEMLSRVGRGSEAVAIQQKAVQIGTPLIGKGLTQAWADAQKARLEEYKTKNK
ncbi:MAG TPA: TlpA disulfide reductase family protein [Sedimentisphaerales bacterium]|nr:TlpA disulfide reductase family protein [Sedimentisphaerales bacterium]